MDIIGIFGWLFGTRLGVVCLLGVALLGFLIAAVVLERRTREQYDQYDDDSEDGWSDFDDDNK